MRRCLFFLVVTLLVGCVEEEPPGDLRAVSPDQWFSPPDTVAARVLGRELPSGMVRQGRLDSTEQVWLQARDYDLAERYVDSTATHYFRAKAQRLPRWKPRWDKRTLLIERLYVRRPNRENDASGGEALAAGPKGSLGPAEHLDPASTKTTEEGLLETHGSGTWTIVVGSATERTSARALLKSRAEQLSTIGLRVRLQTEQRKDTVRYRVVAGQFDSVAVRQAIESHSSVLPAGAWPLRLGTEVQQ